MAWFTRKTDHNALVSPLLLSVVFGLAAGAVGTLLVAASAPNPEPLFQQTSAQPVGRGAPAAGSVSAASASVRSSALIFRAKKAGSSIVDRSYIPSEAIGGAMVLTSDGWLLSNDMVFTDAVRAALPSYRVVIGSASFAIDTAVVDSFSGVVFVKVDGANLPVTSYAPGTDLAAGDEVVIFDASGGPRRAQVIGYGSRPAKDASALIRSSEHEQDVLRLSPTDGVVPSGSMVIDMSGEAVAVFVGDDASGSTAVPFDAFSSQISSVLKDRKVHRPYFGVRYIDLSTTLGVAELGAHPHGALLMASADGKPAVQRRSPADDAKLLVGDLILAVNGQELGTETALADVLAEYQPGSSLTVTVRRNGIVSGTDVTIPVMLGEAP